MNIPEMPVGWLPLADAVAKTTLILLAAAVASIVLRSASAALRHLVWTLALSSALFLPIASFALPKWQLPLVTITAPAPAIEAVHSAGDSLPAKAGSHTNQGTGSLPASAVSLSAQREDHTNHGRVASGPSTGSGPARAQSRAGERHVYAVEVEKGTREKAEGKR
jgi:hypothetical protein